MQFTPKQPTICAKYFICMWFKLWTDVLDVMPKVLINVVRLAQLPNQPQQSMRISFQYQSMLTRIPLENNEYS